MKKTGLEEPRHGGDVEKQLARIVPLWGAIVRYQQKAGVMDPVSLLSWCVRLYQAGYEDGGVAVERNRDALGLGVTGEEADWEEEETGRRVSGSGSRRSRRGP